jgi:hypothetical protein
MTRTSKVLLIVGAVICFGPAVSILISVVPVGGPQILLWARLLRPDEFFRLFGPMIGGVLGLLGVTNLLFLLCGRFHLFGPRVSLVFLACGLGSVLMFSILYLKHVPLEDWLILVALPIVATGYLGYLARRFLFPRRHPNRDVVPSA